MSAFVFEIGLEEMPARFLPDLEAGLEDLAREHLTREHIDHADVQVFSTPRRLVLWVAEMAAIQESRSELITGPPKAIAYSESGELTKAGQGFARNQGVNESDIFIQDTPKGEYLAVQKQVGGQKTEAILPGICAQIVGKLPMPKRMRWESSGFLFARPIRWLLALLDDTVIPVHIASLNAGRQTWGHRVHGPGPLEVPRAEEYFDLIRNQGSLILNRHERRQMIQETGDALARDEGGSVVWNDSLLAEVASLVELPMPILGRFDSQYLELPKEVLLTSMESHQKSFGLQDAQGNLLPFFLCTLNLKPKDLELVRKGWERVLKARLEDAAFFWKVDSKATLEQWLAELDKVVFLGPLGSMGDRVRRLQQVSAYLTEGESRDVHAHTVRAAALAKVDLVSEMVGEFDNLQGIMGGIYARQKGDPDPVAQAIAEHYLPTGPESEVPASLVGAYLSIVDKADALAGCFGLNMIPTGTQDPYALRRQALGIVRTAWEHRLRFSLDSLLDRAFDAYQGVAWKLDKEAALSALREFFAHRIRALCTGQGIGTRVVDAALNVGFDDLWAFEQRLQALERFSRESDFDQAVLTFKRADNIIRKQGDQAGVDLRAGYREDLLAEPQEKALARALTDMQPRWEQLWAEEDFDQLFALLRELRPVVDDFFDHVMVMADDHSLRQNRLNMLQSLVDRLSVLADFSALQI
ncbi:glycine--tRNA ligase subunit beta [Desulfovermiculus halophilus]|jgi:glycyl-tRNA synthetase beta chain|uniref:glycine--tRNA ligase subunit beta n=1 Tax=Desulfovermiculus halophilus TaxID=339722 RepID=UPI0004806EBD|nr:glycine--tRNA ligase subunit beta [Desulfovermiculus halophilus]